MPAVRLVLWLVAQRTSNFFGVTAWRLKLSSRLWISRFVGIVGIFAAGPQALVAIHKFGLTLLLLGVGVTLIPQIVTFFFSYHVLRIRNPVEALACVAGGRAANLAFAALLEKAGNATPVVSFTVTYAVANVLLTLWGPIIVDIITKNVAS